jgi:hypothetical protein
MSRSLFLRAGLFLASAVAPFGLAASHLPLVFEQNQGQTDPAVRYLGRASDYTLFLTGDGMVMSFRDPASPVTMRVAGANPAARIQGEGELPGRSNYFAGSDPARWRHAAQFSKVRYGGVYPGIDLVFYGSDRQIEYDFVIAPHADLAEIRLAFSGVRHMAVDGSGDLLLDNGERQVRLVRPKVYQEVAGTHQDVAGKYLLLGHDEVAFQVEGRDPSYPLVIDPLLTVATYLGGSGDDAIVDLALDPAGNIYVAGTTNSIDFPATTGAAQMQNRGLPKPALNAFVAKLDPSGSTLLYATYLGGSGNTTAVSLAVDASGAAYLTGQFNSADFPLTAGAYRYTATPAAGAYIAKVAADGSSLSYGAAPCNCSSFSIAVNASKAAYIAAETFPGSALTASPGAFQTTPKGGVDGIVASLDPAGAQLTATFLGGSADDHFAPQVTQRLTSVPQSILTPYGKKIVIDGQGRVVVAGTTTSTNFPTAAGAYRAAAPGGGDVFISVLDSELTALIAGTYYGGPDFDGATAIALDNAGNVYLAGVADLTVQADSQSSFMAWTTLAAKFNPTLTALAYAAKFRSNSSFSGTNVGAPNEETDVYGDLLAGIAVDSAQNAWLAGTAGAFSQFVPYPPGSYSSNESRDVMLTRLDSAGNISQNYPFGGAGADIPTSIAINAAGDLVVAGVTQHTDFITSYSVAQPPSSGGWDGFVVKVTPSSCTVTLSPFSVVLPASQSNGSLAVTTAPSCTWRVGALPAWLTASPASGTGNGTITLTAQANPGGSAQRTVTIGVNDQGSVLTQAAGGCTFTVTPLAKAVRASSYVDSITVTTSPETGCVWNASSNITWISMNGSGTSPGSGQIAFTVAANTSATQRTGTITVAGQNVTVTQAGNNPQQGPSLVSLNPYQGTGPNATLTLVYSHPAGWSAIQSAEFIINPRWESGLRAGGCYVKYAPATDRLTLIANDGSSIGGSATAGSATSLSNSQCTLNTAASSATGNGNTLTLVVALTFQPSFGGQRHIWMQAVDYNNISTNWMVYGVWFPTATTVNTGPWYRIFDPFSNSYLYTFDQNEYNTLGSRGFVQQGISGLVMDSPATVGGISNIAWYRVFVNSTNSHLWTSDRNEFLTLIQFQQAYVGEGVAAFVMPYLNPQGQISPRVTNTIPFWRAAFNGKNLHFWTSDLNEYNSHLPTGYFQEGIACFIFPASGAQFTALNALAEPAPPDDGGLAANPTILGTNQFGRGIAQARNSGGRIHDTDHPAARGSVVTLYTTGIATDLPVEVHIGGRPAEVISTHPSGTRSGVIEVRVRVPMTVEPAPFQPVVLHAGELFSQPGVGLAIR